MQDRFREGARSDPALWYVVARVYSIHRGVLQLAAPRPAGAVCPLRESGDWSCRIVTCYDSDVPQLVRSIHVAPQISTHRFVRAKALVLAFIGESRGRPLEGDMCRYKDGGYQQLCQRNRPLCMSRAVSGGILPNRAVNWGESAEATCFLSLLTSARAGLACCAYG